MTTTIISSGVSDSAVHIEHKLSEMFDRGCSIFWQNSLKNKSLDYLQKAIFDNNSLDGLPTSEVLNSFNEFTKLLPSTFPVPEFGIDPDGEISLDWIRSRRSMLSISIGPNNTLNFAGKFGRAKVHGFEIFNGEIPDEIIRNLERLFSQNST